jgi:hypothetical protein
MKKRAFIPKSYRPDVPGSKLCEPEQKSCSLNTTHTLDGELLVISAREDIVPESFLNQIDSRNEVIRLHYDELGVNWDFIFQNGILTVLTPGGIVRPKSIYHRHPGITQNHPYYKKHIAFFEVLDVWKGNLIGQRRDHHHNFSKAYQAVTSLREAKRKIGDDSIKYPRSFFIKGTPELLDNLQIALIVKSCSNTRSRVVCKEEYGKWDLDNLNNLPTLFQEKIIGKDIRVHVCHNNIWSLLVDTKDCVDYRYSTKGSVTYKAIQLPPALQEYCLKIADFEKNKLIGIDLMLSEQEYFCLESNPGPGWSTYNHPSKREFADHVFKQLQMIV